MRKVFLVICFLLLGMSLLALLTLSRAALAVLWTGWVAQAAPMPAPEQAQGGLGSLSPSRHFLDASELSYQVVYSVCAGSGSGVAVDGTGNAYVVGTYSNSVSVIKLDESGTPVPDYGPPAEYGSSHGGIAVDQAGHVYYTIWRSPSLVLKLDTQGNPAYYLAEGNGLDVDVDSEGHTFVTGPGYVAKANIEGTGLEWKTAVSGGNGWGIAVDGDGNAYATGGKTVVKVNAEGVVDSSWITSTVGDASGIAVDGEGHVYVTTWATKVVRLDLDGTVARTTTLPNGFESRAIAVDQDGDAYVTGRAWNFGEGLFVAKVSSDGALTYAFFGATSSDRGHGIAVDEAGDVYVTGVTMPPITAGSICEFNSGFVIKLEMETEPTIKGTVLLQGRTAHAGAEIYLRTESCSAPLPSSPGAVTNDEGFFDIARVPGQTYQCLEAFLPGYLMGETSSLQENLGTLTLPAGDVNQDNRINILDLSLIAQRYHGTDPVADLNDDGIVDIYDLVLAGGNFGVEGPVTDWQ